MIRNNRALFIHIPTRHISENDITNMSNPTTSGEGGQGLLESAFDDDNLNVEADSAAISSLDQLSNDMMTLSLIPKSRWQTLVHLDLIRQRNKPIEPPKVPEMAPFFLPSLNSVNAITSTEDDQSAFSNLEKSRILKIAQGLSDNPFSVLLREGAEMDDCTWLVSVFIYSGTNT
jgi:U3 small nucleolar RNA-associated protein 21